MICRPILLHNEFMPACHGERDWHYQVLGYHDGMTVENRFEILDVNSFKEMFNKCIEYEDKEMHPYFTQFFFCFHPDGNKDNDFWDSEYNFTFFSLLQLNNEKIEEKRRYLDDLNFDDAKVISYYSLDNSDLIFAIKCNSCKMGFNIISKLHINNENTLELRNSYTVLALKKEDINTSDKFKEFNEKIDILELRIVEKDSNSTLKLYDKLYYDLHHNDTCVDMTIALGTEDNVIIIKNLNWIDLIPFYQNGQTGILCNSNKAIDNYANAVSAKVMFLMQKNKKIISDIDNNLDSSGKKRDISNLLCKVIYNNIESIYFKREKTNGISNAEKKNLKMLASALWRFEYAHNNGKVFSDYNFFPILESLYMFTELAKNTNDIPSNFYYSFMKGMKLCTQNFTKPDRVYSQITDFNVRYFDVPAKLVLFYSAYMFYLKRVLNQLSCTENKCKYEFLVCPGVNSKTQVKEIFTREFPGDNKNTLLQNRLFFVEIPEQQIYSPKEMLIVLGHETAHFVGRTIRKREKRFNYIIESCSHAVTISLKHYVLYAENWDENYTDSPNWNLLEERLEEWIKYSINQYTNPEYLKQRYYESTENNKELIERNQKFYNENYKHTDVLKKILCSSIEELLIKKGLEILGFTIWEGLSGKTAISLNKQDDYERYSTVVNNAVYSFVDSHGRCTELSLEKVIDDIIFLFKECYADMICILILNLSMNDYLYSFVEVFKSGDYNLEYITNSILLPRIAIVIQAMHYGISNDERSTTENRVVYWNNDELNKLKSKEVIKIEIESQKFWENLKKDPCYYRGEVTENTLLAHGVNIIYDSLIAKTVLRYLLECRNEFDKLVNDMNCKNYEHLKNVRNFYKVATTENIDSFFPDMMDLLNVYEKDVYENIKRILNQLKGKSNSGEQ